MIVYSTPDRIDKGYLSEFQIDLAYGKSENDFELTMPLRERELTYGYYIYSEDDANIGGVIDTIEVKSASKQIIYKGRTWHGMMAEKIIEPYKYNDYFIVSGDANDAIAELAARANLSGFFAVSLETSGINIANYQVRYGDLYSSLVDMLSKADAKLKIDIVPHVGGWNIVLSAVSYINYYNIEEWSNNNRDFDAEHCDLPINHMICLGRGNLRDRKVIHLYSDGVNIMRYIKKSDIYMKSTGEKTNYEVTGVVPKYVNLPTPSASILYKYYCLYTGEVYVCVSLVGIGYKWELQDSLVAKPSDEVYMDSDYITDKGMEQYFYEKERAVVFDYGNAEVKENYVKLSSQPADWTNNYKKYFKKSDDGYTEVTGVEAEEYVALTSKPADWDSNVSKYYEAVGGMGGVVTYHSVDELDVDVYTLLSTAPASWAAQYGLYYRKGSDGIYYQVEGVTESGYNLVEVHTAINDWNNNYGNYYTRAWNGTTWVYTAVPGVRHNRYINQTKQPDDWSKNYHNYYYYDNGVYKKVVGETKKVKGKTKTVAPKWVRSRYYTQYSYTGAPNLSTYDGVDLFLAYSRTVAPAFISNTFYRKDTRTSAPTFTVGDYYSLEKVIQAPAFGTGVYKLYLDNYADLVEKGIKKFTELMQCDKINVTLNPIEQYDIGDVVGARDEVTGLSVAQPITKKIFKITKDRKSISYEIGG